MARPLRFAKPKKKIAKRQLELRAQLWPDITDEDLWSRHTHDGFTTVPNTMPLLMAIMDELSNGQPVSSTYLELWCRAFDENFVTLSKPQEMAFHAGFSSQRAERTWKTRLKILDELGFIDLQSGPSGPASYALILNPYLAVRRLYEQRHPGLRQDAYNALIARAIEIGDDSLTTREPAPASAPESAVARDPTGAPAAPEPPVKQDHAKA